MLDRQTDNCTTGNILIQLSMVVMIYNYSTLNNHTNFSDVPNKTWIK